MFVLEIVTDWLTDWLIGWLAGWLAGRLTDRPTDWLTDLYGNLLTYLLCLPGYPTACIPSFQWPLSCMMIVNFLPKEVCRHSHYTLTSTRKSWLKTYISVFFVLKYRPTFSALFSSRLKNSCVCCSISSISSARLSAKSRSLIIMAGSSKFFPGPFQLKSQL